MDTVKEKCLYFTNKYNYQTVLFISMLQENRYELLVDSTKEKVIRKYMIWQAKENPKNKHVEKSENLVYSHVNDLAWNDCKDIVSDYLIWFKLHLAEKLEYNEKELQAISKDDPFGDVIITESENIREYLAKE